MNRPMKKLLIALLMLPLSVSAQSSYISEPATKTDSIIYSLGYEIQSLRETLQTRDRYKLYPTTNTYNSLLLDTKTGRIEQVQWSQNRDNEGSFSINSTDLSYAGYTAGSFELYPTPNMFQFILIDKVNGRKWHVQWGLKSSEMWIRQIY